MNKVYIKDFKTRSVIWEIDVSHIAGTISYDRFVIGLARSIDLDKYFLDDDEYQKEQKGDNHNDD